MTDTVRQGGSGGGTNAFVTRYAYDDAGNSTVTTDANGHKTEVKRDGLDRIFSQTIDTATLNLATTYTYDGNGNLRTVTSPGTDSKPALTITYPYDGLGRKIKAEYEGTADDQGFSPVMQYFYDGDNNLARYVDMRGTTFTTTYDNLNRAVANTADHDPNAGILVLMSSVYDDSANTVTEKDANGNETVTKYDGVGRPLT